GEVVQFIALFRRHDKLIDCRRIEPRHRILLERKEDANDAGPDPVRAEIAERLRRGAEPVDLAALDRELRVLRLDVALDHLELHPDQPPQALRRPVTGPPAPLSPPPP